MADTRHEKMARLLVRYARGVQAGQTVLIAGTTAAEPLMREIAREVYRAGAVPSFRMSPDGVAEIMYAEADEGQIGHVAKWQTAAFRESDHYINILCATNTQALAGADPDKQVAWEKARRRLLDIMLNKGDWTLTLFPTAAYAQDAGMGLEEFEAFAFRAMALDRRDPVAYWKKEEAFEKKLIDRLQGADRVRIVAEDTDLSLSVKGRTFVPCCGHRNMPDGEVFTGPVETSAEGHIRYTYPVCYRGKEVEDVRLEFEKGKVVKATAAKNQAFLERMIGMDKGASRLGELGIGTNFGIQGFIKNILFDEKIGGSVHLALGNGYAETGSTNKSALHWDMICDLRQGGYLEVDGKVVQADGAFRV